MFRHDNVGRGMEPPLRAKSAVPEANPSSLWIDIPVGTLWRGRYPLAAGLRRHILRGGRESHRVSRPTTSTEARLAVTR